MNWKCKIGWHKIEKTLELEEFVESETRIVTYERFQVHTCIRCEKIIWKHTLSDACFDCGCARTCGRVALYGDARYPCSYYSGNRWRFIPEGWQRNR